jgi:protein-tyrosine phosphatase
MIHRYRKNSNRPIINLPGLPEREILPFTDDSQTISFKMANPSKICDGLYLGCVDNAYNEKILTDLGITAILNLAKECDDKSCLPEGELGEKVKLLRSQIEILHIELVDSSSQEISDILVPCVEFISRIIEGGGVVLVHCKMGISRAATIVMAYLMIKKKFNVQDALGHVRSVRPLAMPNFGFYITLLNMDNERENFDL